jgi:hypothetical protein
VSSFSFLSRDDQRILITNEATICIELWFPSRGQLHKAHTLELPHIAAGVTTTIFECVPLSPDILDDPSSLISFDLHFCTRDGRQSGSTEIAVDTAYFLSYGLQRSRTTKWKDWGPANTQMVIGTGNEPHCNTGGRNFITKRYSERISSGIDNPDLLSIYNLPQQDLPTPQLQPSTINIPLWGTGLGPNIKNAFSRPVHTNKFNLSHTIRLPCSKIIHHDGWLYAIKVGAASASSRSY